MNAKRKHIIDAAHHLFVEKGFAQTSIQDILDKANVAKGTFYNYFNSKNECLMAILDTVTDEVDQKRREIALGKDKRNEEVFVEQIAVRMNMNKENRLLAVFETVSFSEDKELKLFMKEQHLVELKWITKRIGEIYPAEAQLFILDHAVMLVGIIHHMMHVWMLGKAKEIETEKIVRYALRRVKSMINEQVKTEKPLFPENWLRYTNENVQLDPMKVIDSLEKFSQKLSGESIKKRELIEFLIKELQVESPRTILIESVLNTFEHAFLETEFEHEAKNIVNLVWRMI